MEIGKSATQEEQQETTSTLVEQSEMAFNAEQVQQIAKECVESNLANQPYHHNKVPQWNSNIVEMTLKRLTQLNKPYKYIVTCVIMQKNGAGLHAASSCYWDHSTDSSTTFQFESKTLIAIVNIFGLGI